MCELIRDLAEYTKYLVHLKSQLFYWLIKGTIVLVFQPAEEGGAGAKKMLDDGALENVEAIFGLHVSSKHPVGKVASRPGPILAASGFFEAVISGKGGHAAIPQHTIDPILAASNVIVNLQHLVSREADPLDSQVCKTNVCTRAKFVLSVISFCITCAHKLFRKVLPSVALWFWFSLCKVHFVCLPSLWRIRN